MSVIVSVVWKVIFIEPVVINMFSAKYERYWINEQGEDNFCG